jgi:hypothetical protein
MTNAEGLVRALTPPTTARSVKTSTRAACLDTGPRYANRQARRGAWLRDLE